VIYELLDDAKAEMSKLLAAEIVETPVGELLIKGVFRTTKDEIIAGGLVESGKIMPKILARIWRGGSHNVKRTDDESIDETELKKKGGELLAEVEITSVQREKAEAKEVFEGEMCGVNLKLHSVAIDPETKAEIRTGKFVMEIGDRLEAFTREMKKRAL
jgi:translation initiation factor IF-2